MSGTVISETTKGFCFAEANVTHQCVFIHISEVKGERCLHVSDRVSFELITNPIRGGQQMGGHVEYLGHAIDQALRR